MKRCSSATSIAVALSIFAMAGTAYGIPTVVPYLGYLVHDAGAPVHAVMDIEVQVFSEEVGGSSLWGPHAFVGVPVVDGLFTLPLGGSGSPDLAPALDGGAPLWLAFKIDGTTMSPRQRILAVPFARRAEVAANATHLGGLPPSAFATLAGLPHVALSGSFNDLDDVPTTLAQANGAAGAIAKFTGSAALGDSVLVEVESKVGVNQSAPQATLHVGGTIQIGDDGSACSSARAGSLRWTGSALELCDGTAWAAFGAPTDPGGNGDPGDPGGGDPGTLTFSHTGGTQAWTVPEGISSVHIDAYGAQGGAGFNGASGGLGARMAADVVVTPGQVLTIAVGGAGQTGQHSIAGGGGGGGSFVYHASGLLLVAGGGGGGSHANNAAIGSPGLSGELGGLGGYPSQPRSATQGGYSDACCGGGTGAGGGGWAQAGLGNQWASGGSAGGGSGGTPSSSTYAAGGYGGAGAAFHGGGGGGGYTGGNGGTYTVGAGGGGSFTVGSNAASSTGVRSGHGQVTLTW